MTNPSSGNQQPGQQQTGASQSNGLFINDAIDPTLVSSTAAASISSLLTEPTINAGALPPTLKTFVYSPNVKVTIAASSTLLEYDVSADIVRCNLIRPENSAATFFMTLQNKQLRYTPPVGAPLFSRMDRICVYMFKTSWIQVFSGYLDTVPYKQLYPGTVDFKATCTIKRLMHTWFDPALPDSQQLLSSFNTASSMLQGDGGAQADSGLGSLLRALLSQVGNWGLGNIHIQNFPTNFYNYLNSQIQNYTAQAATNLQTFETSILGSDTSLGPGSQAGYNSNAGQPGPFASEGTGLTGTSFYISQITAACDAMGLGPSVQTNNVAAGLIQSGATGETSGSPYQNPGQQKAWQQVQSTGQALQTANTNTDAAILGTAAAMVQSGAGVNIMNWANAGVPQSTTFPNDGITTNGTSCGIMMMDDRAQWGDVSQRMNAMQAATMMMTRLPSGWQTMDPGQAIQQALNVAPAMSVAFDGAFQAATKLVQAYRATLGAAGSAVASAGIPGTSVASSTLGAAAGGSGGAPSIAAGVVAGATTTPAPGSVLGVANPLTSAQPAPNSEGAINFARTCLGLPYIYGSAGPASYDCSGLVSSAFKAIGINTGRTTYAIAATVPSIPQTAVQRGDIVEPSAGHVVLWMGDGTIIEAATEGVPIHQVVNPYGPPGSWYGAYRACQNGGLNPTAAFNPPAMMGPGNPPGALDQVGGATSSGSNGSAEGVARNLFADMFLPTNYASSVAGLFSGEKAFIEGIPLLQMVMAIASAGLRSWSSAPNGDFMAWYPDYFGIDGKPAVMLLADIEMKDCSINFSDDPMTTHVYINGDMTYGLDTDTPQAQLAGWLTTAGIATVEDEWLFQRLKLTAPSDLDSLSGIEIMQRFGVRPLKQVYAMAGDQSLELMLACQVFMQKWAQQYQTTVQMTFMPELFPGMRVELAGHNLQVYISQVTHQCDFERGFTTSITISAPSNPNGKQLMDQTNTPYASASQSILGAFDRVNSGSMPGVQGTAAS